MSGILANQMSESVPSANLIIGIRKEVKNKIPYGYCHCGCGSKTPLAKHTSTRDNTIKGLPTRYLPAHSLKKYHKRGNKSLSWKGGKIISSGYLKIHAPNHPNNNMGYIPNSNLVTEKALGKFLPKKAIVHHINSNRLDDNNTNLVVCESIEYHNLLHRRSEAYKICGNANWRKCRYCGKYDDPKNMYQEPFRKGQYTDSCRHRKCFAIYTKAHNEKIKNESATQTQTN